MGTAEAWPTTDVNTRPFHGRIHCETEKCMVDGGCTPQETNAFLRIPPSYDRMNGVEYAIMSKILPDA